MQKRFARIEAVLGSLPVFEAAARNRSFTKAAEELNLTQPTVSHHIRQIEAVLDAELFRRRHNRLVVTEAGAQLAEAISLGLTHIDNAAREIAIQRTEGALTLACSFGFAHGWLMPRFSRFRQAVGPFPINLVTTDWLEGFDLETADIVVVWAGVGSSKRQRMPLFPEDVSPVASPAFAEAQGLDRDGPAERLLDRTLVHFDERDSQFLNWEKWFATQGLGYAIPTGCYKHSNYQFMVQAIAEGEGIGLGWTQLIEEQLKNGQLVRVGPEVRNRNTAYALEVRRGRVPDDIMDLALDWFRGETSGGS